jgi:lipoate synthase
MAAYVERFKEINQTIAKATDFAGQAQTKSLELVGSPEEDDKILSELAKLSEEASYQFQSAQYLSETILHQLEAEYSTND